MKIKLIRTTRIFANMDLGTILLPPIPLTVYKELLSKKHDVEIDDFDIKILHDLKLLNTIRIVFSDDKIKKYDIEIDDFDLKIPHNQKLIKTTETIFSSDEFKQNQDKLKEKVINKLLLKIEYKNYDLIGFSVPDSPSLSLAIMLAQKIKKETGCKIALGGKPFVNKKDSKTIKKTYGIDYIHTSHSYFPFVDYIDKLNNKNKKTISKNFLSFTIPNYNDSYLEYYKNIPKSNYNFSNIGNIIILPYKFTSGCPYKCSFCMNSSSTVAKEIFFFKQPETVVSEILKIKKIFSTPFFFFLSNTLNGNLKYLSKLCDIFIEKKLNIIWCDSVSPGDFKGILPKLRKAGCVSLVWGVESGSDRILKSMKKPFTIKQAETTIRASHKAGIWNTVNIIIGYPHENDNDYKKTKHFIIRNIKYIDNIQINRFRLSTSAILDSPEKFKIKIIKKISVARFGGRERFSYNERGKGGLNWEEKNKQCTKRSIELENCFKKNKIHFINKEKFYDLLYLYKKLKTKEKIYEWLKTQYFNQN